MTDSKRRFRLVEPMNGGIYTGRTPGQAAQKAFSCLAKKNKNSKKEISFSIQETTQDSKRKETHYKGKRIKLKEPTVRVIRSRDGTEQEVVYEYKNQVRRDYDRD